MMDSSDGLWRSVDILCRASRVGARVEVERLPLSPALRAWARSWGRDPRDAALVGGEDYELGMTTDPSTARKLEAKGWAKRVGFIVPVAWGIEASEKGEKRRIPDEFEHFNR